MKILIRGTKAFVMLGLIALTTVQIAFAAEAPKPGGPSFSWLNGSWSSKTGILTMEIGVVNGNELAGSASFNYGSGWASGQLHGRVNDDAIQITVTWQRGTSSSYEFRKQEDGSLLGIITAGNDLGRTVRMRKS